jgi:hypothetical protein
MIWRISDDMMSPTVVDVFARSREFPVLVLRAAHVCALRTDSNNLMTATSTHVVSKFPPCNGMFSPFMWGCPGNAAAISQLAAGQSSESP